MAERVDDAGGEYWYIPETLEFTAETDALIEEACEGNSNYSYCRTRQAIKFLGTYGNKYQAVWQLKHQNFTLSAVNPYRGTIRIYYNGFNSQSEQEKADISELYLYWVEEGTLDPQTNYTLADVYVEQMRAGTTVDGVHPILVKNENESESIITGEETRFVVSSDDLVFNMRRKIFFTLINTVGDEYFGVFNYGNCMSSISRDDGKECRGAYYLINDTYTYLFDSYEETPEDQELPLWEEGTSTTEPEPEEPEYLEEPEEPTDSENPEASEDATTPEYSEEPELEPGQNISQETDTQALAKTPNTGAITKNTKNSDSSPWWQVTVAISAMVVLWFMLPSHKNLKKSS